MTIPALTHSQWRSILLPVAREAVDRGDFADLLRDHQKCPDQRENYARIIASYAATDMVLSRRTLWFPMAEVHAAMDARFDELGRIGDECERRAAEALGDALPTAPPLCRPAARAATRLGSDERLPLSQEG